MLSLSGVAARLVALLPPAGQAAPARPRQLFVDVSVIARRDGGTGIQRVVRALWLQLHDTEWSAFEVVPIVATRRMRYRLLQVPVFDGPKETQWRRFPLARPRAGDVFFGLDLGAHIVPARRRQFRTWQGKGVRLVFMVYDLLPVQRPDWFDDRLVRAFRQWLAFVVSHADHAICISRAVAADLAGHVANSGRNRTCPLQISPLALAGDIRTSRPSRGLGAQADQAMAWMDRSPTVLMVGTIEPRKGHAAALAAFDHIRNDWVAGRAPASPDLGAPPQLLVVGRPGWKSAGLQQALRDHNRSGGMVRWIDDASDELLEQLYRKASLLLFASHGEGFGLPLLEAAGHDLPILARDLPVLREVAPEGSLFFSDDSPAALAEAVLQGLRAAPGSKAARPPQRSWREVFEDLAGLLAEP